jgi:hypothetical protein
MMSNQPQPSPDSERQITRDDLDALVLKYGTPAEKKRILEERSKAQNVGIGNLYGRQ